MLPKPGQEKPWVSSSALVENKLVLYCFDRSAFLIPLVEKLYRERWSDEDGLAAIIITPTRELALQIFDVLRVVGKQQQLSAGIVTGGKTGFEDEQERVLMMNILVATPGRLLQVTTCFCN